MQYYIIHNDKQYGPMEVPELVNYGLSTKSMVWAAGMPAWVEAEKIDEIRQFIENAEPKYMVVRNNQQYGPFAVSELRRQGISSDTLVWKEGMEAWLPAGQVDDFKHIFQTATPPPFAQQPPHCSYAPGSNYASSSGQCSNPQLLREISNLRTWAIIAIIAGFLVSCIGGVFGIVGFCKLNNARDFLLSDAEFMAQSAYNSAQTWLIVAACCIGIGLIVNGFSVLSVL